MRFTSVTGSIASKKQTKEQKSQAGKKGFERTMETHPFFARNWLRKKIKATYPKGRVVSEITH